MRKFLLTSAAVTILLGLAASLSVLAQGAGGAGGNAGRGAGGAGASGQWAVAVASGRRCRRRGRRWRGQR